MRKLEGSLESAPPLSVPSPLVPSLPQERKSWGVGSHISDSDCKEKQQVCRKHLPADRAGI